MDKTVLLETRDGVATVTLNRPEGANALDMAMGRDLLEVALRVEADPAVRAVVVTGAGKHFCFGGDLRGMVDAGRGRRRLPERAHHATSTPRSAASRA